MKSLNNLISSLQQNISQRNPTALVYSSKMNQKILKILQINGFIDGFFFFNNQKILVYFKHTSKGNAIQRIFRFKNFTKYKFNGRRWYKFAGASQFTIFTTRQGLLTNKQLLLADTAGIPLVGIL